MPQIVTPEMEVSIFCNVFEKALQIDKKSWKYDIQLLIPKTDREGVKALQAAVLKAAVDFFGPDKSKWPEERHNPLVDGDLYNAKRVKKGEDAVPVLTGKYFFKAKTDRKPPVVGNVKGPDGKLPPLGPEEFYPSCSCRAIVIFQGFQKAGAAGVYVILKGIMKTGEVGISLDAAFAEYAEETPTQAKPSTPDDDFLGLGDDEDIGF